MEKEVFEFRSFSGFPIPRKMAEDFYEMFPTFALNPEILGLSREELESLVGVI